MQTITRFTKLKQYGLIGYPLGHSFSRKYFADKFEREQIDDAHYDNFPLDDIQMLPSIIQANPGLIGLNVTIPYKSEVIAFCDELDEEAAAIGAVNTLLMSGQGRIKGFNTDIPGFRNSLLDFLGDLTDLNALVLGTGGAAKAVCFVLNSLEITHQLVSRRPGLNQITYDDLDKTMIDGHQLIINTTPVGMSPHEDLAPMIPYEYVSDEHYIYDLIYNPEETLFMARAAERGAQVKNGYQMLVLQAEESWKIWNT